MCISWNFNETDLVSFFFFFLGVVYRKFLFLHQIRKINGPGLPLKERELEKPASSQGWALGAGGIQTSWQHFFVHFPQFWFYSPHSQQAGELCCPSPKKGGGKVGSARLCWQATRVLENNRFLVAVRRALLTSETANSAPLHPQHKRLRSGDVLRWLVIVPWNSSWTGGLWASGPGPAASTGTSERRRSASPAVVRSLVKLQSLSWSHSCFTWMSLML